MNLSIEWIGFLAAGLTTLCWLPQALKILRDKCTHGVSLLTQCAFALGVFFWLVYGVALGSWPIIVANAVTLVLALAIVALKLRYP